jgi:peptidyl-prolyl cis-trans isomerase SurA
MKKMISKTALILFGAVLVCGAASAETVERIAAVVGDRIILATEVTNQMQMVMIQAGQNAADIDPTQLADDILLEMVNDELILSAARDDTTIIVSDAEVKATLDEHIASLVARFPSESAFLEQLRAEGWTKRSYEKRLRVQIRDQLMKQQIINRRLALVTVSRQEVEDFFERYADSLPEMPPSVRLAHVLVSFNISSQTDDSLKALAEDARELAVEGADFVDIASQMGGDAVGGRIGYVKREELVAEFARAAFNLQPGAVSGPVKTQYGWHIIKSHDKRTDSVDVSHILFPTFASAADTARARFVIDSLYEKLLRGADFKETAKLHSQDDATRATGGEMEAMTVDQLRPEFVAPLQTIEEGEITPPVMSELGYHILKLLERTDGRPLDIKEDFDIIRNMSRQEKTSRMVQDWVEELKKRVYVDVRDINITQ